jgi:thioesterase domain-containing protein
VHDDFFDLGGHSLLTLGMFAKIERRLGVKLPLAVLFQGATIADLARAVKRERASTGPRSLLMPLQPNGSKPPLYIVHQLNGELLKYRDLLRALDPDQPVWGINPVGFDRRELPLADIDAMAARFVAELRTVQPHGPYRLFGQCFAGVVAYEMARHLNEAGEEIEFLAILESNPLGVGAIRRRTRLELERDKWGEFMRSDLLSKRAWLWRRTRGVKRKVEVATGKRLYRWYTSRGRRLPRGPWDWVHIGNRLALERFRSQPSPVPLTVLRLARTDGGETPWRRVATGPVADRVLTAPGINKFNVVKEPYAHLVADELAGALAGAARQA